MNPSRLAKLLAREVAYRSSRSGYRHFSFLGRKEVTTPSAFRSNILTSLFFTFLSLIITVPVLMTSGGGDLENIFIEISMLLILFELFIALLSSVTFTSTFINERLVGILRVLPLREEDVLSAYIQALLLYWGGLSAVFIFLPGMILAIYYSYMGYLPIIQPVMGIVSGFLVLFLSYSVGIAIGTFSPLVKKRSILRLISAVAWLLVFILFYAGSSLVRYITPVIGGEIPDWMAMIPFIGLTLVYKNILGGIISATTSIVIIYLSYRIASLKLRELLMLEYKIQPTRAPKALEKEVKTIKVKPRGMLEGFVLKDIRLISREPRRLANILYLLVIPILMFLPGYFSNPPGKVPSFVLTTIGAMLGLFSGTTVSTLFFIEGSGAHVLYTLPISRRKLAIVKTVETCFLTLPGAAIVFALSLYLSTDILISTVGAIFVLIASFSTGIALSALVVRQLPEAPSDWTEGSISRARYGVAVMFYYILLMVATFLILFSVENPLLAFTYTAIVYLTIGTTLFTILSRNKPV